MSNSTKQKIKDTALSLFAKKGYEGTTMNEIADIVGIKKPSLYAHFSGKEELFFAIYEQLAEEYTSFMDKLMAESEHMETQERLYFLFERYIAFYTEKPEIQSFWNQIVMFTPKAIHKKFFTHVKSYEEDLQQKMQDIFALGIKEGVIRSDSPAKMFWSYRILREGILNWMLIVPDLKKEDIRCLWTDLWLGIKGRGEENEKCPKA
jgi:AcrR family transcriptional regulator